MDRKKSRSFPMMVFIVIILLVLAIIVITLYNGNSILLGQKGQEENVPAADVVDLPINMGMGLDALDEIKAVEPIDKNAKCSYNPSKCIANLRFVYSNSNSELWTVFMYCQNGEIGTEIINEQGESICFGGEVLTAVKPNYYVEIGNSIRIYPEGKHLNKFMVTINDE